MSTSLYLPPINARVTKDCGFAKDAMHAKMDYLRKLNTKAGRERTHAARRICVDVFDTNGHYLATYPSFTAAEIDLDICRNMVSRCVAGFYKHSGGYMFRKARKVKSDIEPLPPRDYSKNIAVLQKHIKCRPCKVTYSDGSDATFATVKAATNEIGCSISNVYKMLHTGRAYKGKKINYINEQKGGNQV